MDRPDIDIPEDPQETDLRALKRAMMRREEALERFRQAKAQMMKRAHSSRDARRPDPAPGQG